MTLKVGFGARLLGAFSLPVGLVRDLDLGPVQLRPGANELDLRSRQGRGPPG